MTGASLEEHLSVAEASAALGCSNNTLLRAIHRGDLAAVQYGRLVRIPRPAFEAFLAAHRVGDQLAPRRAQRRRSTA